MAWRFLTLLLLATFLALPQIAAGQDPPDEICRLLFEAYLNGPRKINTSSIMAASTLVADRGRTSGFWKVVLTELESNDEHSEVHCVRILGNMLAADAAAREALRRQKETGELSASIQAVHLGPEVARALLKRGKDADRFRIDHYAIALARSGVPEARDFFAAIHDSRRVPLPVELASGAVAPAGFQHLDSTRFHAAVGLAQLGDPQGIDWLIAHCDDPNGYVEHARPYGASSGGSFDTCCVAALRQLSGNRTLTTQAEWQAWQKSLDLKQAKLTPVQMADTH